MLPARRPLLACLLLPLLALAGCGSTVETKFDAAAARDIHKILVLQPARFVSGFAPVDPGLNETLSAALKARGFDTGKIFADTLAKNLRAEGYAVEVRSLLNHTAPRRSNYAGIDTDADAIFDGETMVLFTSGQLDRDYGPTTDAKFNLVRRSDGRILYHFGTDQPLAESPMAIMKLPSEPGLRLSEHELLTEPDRAAEVISRRLAAAARYFAAAIRPAPQR